MAVELITASDIIKEKIELYLEDNTLQSGIFREAPRDRLPILAVREDGSYVMLVRRLEIGNYMGEGRGAQEIKKHRVQLYAYDPYFTMSRIGSEYTVYKTEGFALRDGMKVSHVKVHPDMPYDRYCRIQELVETELAEESLPDAPLYAYEADLGYVAKTFNRIDPQDVELAMDIMRRCTHVSESDREILHRHMNAQRVDQFDLLRSMMQEADIPQIFADTQLTIHTFTAMPWDEICVSDMFAYFDGEKVVLLSRTKLGKPFLKPVGEYNDFATAAMALTGDGKVGIERKSLPVGRAKEIGVERCCDAAAVLTLWRDRHAYQFLPYYIINGIGNIYAMEQAVLFAKKKVESGEYATERDVDAQYEKMLEDFSERHGLGSLELKKYFVVLHAGPRTPFPALSSDYVLHANMKTLKIDSGATLFKNGILMSASDQCRCYNVAPEAQRVYDILAENIRREVIPNIHGGMEGKEVYWNGLRPLAKQEGEFRALGMIDPDFSLLEGYNRNIGHTIDKEESCSAAADKTDSRIFETNMIGCIEYQWPYHDYCIGVEDMFFIASEGAIDFVY